MTAVTMTTMTTTTRFNNRSTPTVLVGLMLVLSLILTNVWGDNINVVKATPSASPGGAAASSVGSTSTSSSTVDDSSNKDSETCAFVAPEGSADVSAATVVEDDSEESEDDDDEEEDDDEDDDSGEGSGFDSVVADLMDKDRVLEEPTSTVESTKNDGQVKKSDEKVQEEEEEEEDEERQVNLVIKNREIGEKSVRPPPPPDILWKACVHDYNQVLNGRGGLYRNLKTSFQSYYQFVDYYHSPKRDDMCLVLNNYLHTCSSNRPHYHEVFVHYPIQYLRLQNRPVRRIAFLGGGDSMVLHEALKYADQSLEMVLGLELDQQVTRASFRHFGTSPHFHKHDTVRWFFGDAAKALDLLPTDQYYGTFDLVIVDLLSVIADVLKVNDQYSILQAAMALMHPDGIMIKNEDEGYIPGYTKPATLTSATYPKYVQDILFHDVPVYCLQSFVLGSNTLDFSKVDEDELELVAKNEGAKSIPTIYFKDGQTEASQFDSWFYELPDVDATATVASSGAIDATTTVSPSSPLSVGIMMVLEAENMTDINCDDTSIVQERLRSALVDTVGFTMLDDGSSSVSTGGEEDSTTTTPNPLVYSLLPGNVTLEDTDVQGYGIIFALQEGFVVARCVPLYKYCAVDIQLWKQGIQKMEIAKEAIIAALGSTTNSVYRMITGGMLMKPTATESSSSSSSSSSSEPSDMLGPPRKNTTDSKTKAAVAGDDSIDPRKTDEGIQVEYRASRYVGVPKDQIDYKNATIHSYDNSEAVEQWKSQTAFGHQAIWQYEVPEQSPLALSWNDSNRDSNLVRKNLVRLIEVAITEERKEESSYNRIHHYQVGAGVVIVATWNGGNMILIWDGNRRVDLHFFGFYSKTASRAVNIIEENLNSLIDVSLKWKELVEERFPRGIGNVVNFKNEYASRKMPIWA